jgi:UDP-glucose 4-epimerase
MEYKTCLVTGGLGYIGSHVCVELLEKKFNLIIIDNLSNSKIDKLSIIKKFNKFENKIFFYNIDLINYDELLKIIENTILIEKLHIDIIIHMAGLKAVKESIDLPIKYYENNLVTTINIIKIMEKFNIKNFIFSSSSTVYGSASIPYNEKTQTGIGITNPYGRSKYIQEEILKDINIIHKDWNILILRYFNPIGQKYYEMKEEPNGIPNNLFPYLLKVYFGEIDNLTIFGSNYNTLDGTCVRDFIHVSDLATAHIVSCDAILNKKISGLKIYNVGTGKGTSILELINSFEKVNQTKLKYIFGEKRQGDLESSYCNVDLIKKELGWTSQYTIDDCVKLFNK